MDKNTKIAHALALIEQGMNPHAAAIEAKCQPGAVYVAVRKLKAAAAGICPCCKQPLPDKDKTV